LERDTPKMSKKAIQAVGKRKTAVARATLLPGTGIIRINKRLLKTLKPQMFVDMINEPLMLAEDTATKVDINVTVSGGGVQGQAEAARSAVARALAEFNKKLKKTFLDYDRHLIVWDIRTRETRKPNDSRARAARQKSYR